MPSARRSRAAAARESTPKRSPTPPVVDEDDETGPTASRVESGAEEEEEEDAEDGQAANADAEDDGDGDGDADDTQEQAGSEEEGSSPPVVQQFPRKRRLGRPPKNRPADWDNPEPYPGSETSTPAKRRRGRPSGGGGFRGRARGGASTVTRVAIDKEGNMMDVIDDEVALPEDPDGEEKVDKLGNLQGGREYRVRTFTIGGRGKRQYMLSTEPARCTGFRDSYLFFTKHMQLHKIIINDDEKRDLIARDIIPHSYKGRAIGVVTARSVFREFGARIVVGGKRIIDDYYVTKARERGDVEGELADPNDRLPPPGEPYNKNQYVAWHGASAVYHTGAPSVPLQNGKPIVGKRKVNITSANWQVEHARAASLFNSNLAALRRQNLEGVYDPHTNAMFVPSIMQPTHVRWEEIPPPSAVDNAATKASTSPKLLTNGHDATTNGIHSDSMDIDPPSDTTSIFTPVPAIVSRNFLITDMHFVSAPLSALCPPGPENMHIADDYTYTNTSAPQQSTPHPGTSTYTTSNDDNGVSTPLQTIGATAPTPNNSNQSSSWLVPPSLAAVPPEVYNELPPECRAALDQAKKTETEWVQSWGDERQDGCRAKLRMMFTGVPV